MTAISVQYFDTPYGELMLGVYDHQLCLCDWRSRKTRATVDRRIQKRLNAHYIEKKHPIIEASITQLKEYFQRQRQCFDIPLMMLGTDFQNTVWQGLIKIPFGETLSYSELAEKVATKKAVRAVASANGANALSIFVPCHRVIGSKGTLTGYAGGLDAKAGLIQLENGLQPIPD